MNNKKIVQEVYTKKAGPYHKVFFGFFRYHKGINSFFKKSNYLKSNLKILDAGCGSGISTETLYNLSKEKKLKGIKFYAFDLTQRMLDLFKEHLSKKNMKNIKLKQADVLELEQLPENWKDFNLIVSSGMLEHLSKGDIKKALEGLRDLLKNGGKILVVITKKNFMTKWLIVKWLKAESYKKEEIREIFSNAGFKNISFKKFPLPYNYLNQGGFIIEAEK